MEQVLYPNINGHNRVVLPEWLDTLIFKKLGASYKRLNRNMTNINDGEKETLNYLGTYFPRSFTESFCIFKRLIAKKVLDYSSKTEISIFDFCCGTGGEIIGLLSVLIPMFPNIKKVVIKAFDGNPIALGKYEEIQKVFSSKTNVEIDYKIIPICLDDLYDLETLDSAIKDKFDIVMTFKAINEFVSIRRFEEKNPYSHIAKSLIKKVIGNGVLLFVDITTKDTQSQEWLPKMMDSGLKNYNVVARNIEYSEFFYVSHFIQQDDYEKISWRLIKNKLNN